MPSLGRMRDEMVDMLTHRRLGLPNRGKRPPEDAADIELPNSGRTDPRLDQPDVLGAMGAAAKGYRTVRDTFANQERARDKAGRRR